MSAEEIFDGLAYPGKRKPKVHEAPVAKAVDTKWDAKPTKRYKRKGAPGEFFTISALCQALGYSEQSIRAWEKQNLLPATPFRSPRTKRPNAAGRSTKGRRLWTREQIEGILLLAEEHKVIVNREPPTREFAAAVGRLFDQLAAEERAQ